MTSANIIGYFPIGEKKKTWRQHEMDNVQALKKVEHKTMAFHLAVQTV